MAIILGFFVLTRLLEGTEFMFDDVLPALPLGIISGSFMSYLYLSPTGYGRSGARHGRGTWPPTQRLAPEQPGKPPNQQPKQQWRQGPNGRRNVGQFFVQHGSLHCPFHHRQRPSATDTFLMAVTLATIYERPLDMVNDRLVMMLAACAA